MSASACPPMPKPLKDRHEEIKKRAKALAPARR
jgi:hypothetical protein